MSWDFFRSVAPLLVPLAVSLVVAVTRFIDPRVSRRRSVHADFKATVTHPDSMAFQAADTALAEHIASTAADATRVSAGRTIRSGNVIAILGTGLIGGAVGFAVAEAKSAVLTDWPESLLYAGATLYAVALATYSAALLQDRRAKKKEKATAAPAESDTRRKEGGVQPHPSEARSIGATGRGDGHLLPTDYWPDRSGEAASAGSRGEAQ